MDPTPDPSDEEEEEEEEGEEDDMFGGSMSGGGDPAASTYRNLNNLTFKLLLTLLIIEAKALAEKQMKDAMDMAQGKCTLS